MRKRTKWIITALVIAIFCVAPGIYNTFRDKASADAATAVANAPRQRNILNVNAVVVREQSLADGITVTGLLLPDEEVDLSFETSGKIDSINFNEGSFVREGDLLAKVNDMPLQAQLARYEAQLKLAEDRVYRQNALLERDAVSQEAFEQARTDLAILNAEMQIVRSNIALTELRAPFDGIIGLRRVSEGAYASPSTVLAKLTKISPLKLDLFVPERYASQIGAGTQLVFTVEGRQQPFNARVYAKESSVDPNTLSMAVRARYPNARGELLPGRSASVQIRMKQIGNAIAIPTEAIVPEMGIDKVFLYKDGKAQSVEVKTGLRTDSQIQIVEGLQVGDTLITSGTLQLRGDLPVRLDHIE